MGAEAEYKSIALRGIERVGSDNISQDGAMNEVVGMIARNGSLVPYAPTDTGLNKANDIVMMRVHHTSTTDNIILVRKGGGIDNSTLYFTVSYEDKDTFANNGYCMTALRSERRVVQKEVDEDGIELSKEVVLNTILQFRAVYEIVFVGNRMSIHTDEGIFHFLWENGAYKYIDEIVNEDMSKMAHGDTVCLPSIGFRVTSGIYKSDSEKAYPYAQRVRIDEEGYGNDVPHHANMHKQVEYIKKSSYLEADMGLEAKALVEEIEKAGGLTGYCLVCAAYHLKGTEGEKSEYVMASPIVLMGCPEQSTSFVKANGVSYMYDTLNYYGYEHPKWGHVVDSDEQNRDYQRLWDAEQTDTLVFYGETDNGNNKWLGGKPVLRKFNRLYNRTNLTEDYVDSEGDWYQVESIQSSTRCPMLFGAKYAVYDHNSLTGTYDNDVRMRGVRMVCGTSNILQFRSSGEVSERYSDMTIDSIDIFMSKPILPYEMDSKGSIKMSSMTHEVKCYGANDNSHPYYKGVFFFGETSCNGFYKRNHSVAGGGFVPMLLSEGALRKKIGENSQMLYKVKQYSVSEFNTLIKDGWVRIGLEGVLENIETRDLLDMSAIRKIEKQNGHLFAYNERLHIFDYAKSTAQRVDYSEQRYHGGDGQAIRAEEVVRYEYAVSVVDRDGNRVVGRFTDTHRAINPFIYYPDKEAKRMEIVVRYAKDGHYYVGRREIEPLLSNSLYSYSLQTLEPLSIGLQEVGMVAYSNAFPKEQLMPDTKSYTKNEISVSGVGDIIFPNENNYKVGSGEIIGLARLTMSLSQDNFGRYPLVVFTTEGIYTLEVDTSGNGVYTLQSPTSRMVCTNKDSICELDGAVLFATEYGLMLFTSGGVKPLALHVNGTPRPLPDVKKGLSIYKRAIDHSKLVRMTNDISMEDFIEYTQAEGTQFHYIHTLNSVLLFNNQITHAYLLALDTMVCTKLSERFLISDNDYPKQTFLIEPDTEVRVYKGVRVGSVWEYEDLMSQRESVSVEALLREYLCGVLREQISQMSKDIDVAIRVYMARVAELKEIIADSSIAISPSERERLEAIRKDIEHQIQNTESLIGVIENRILGELLTPDEMKELLGQRKSLVSMKSSLQADIAEIDGKLNGSSLPTDTMAAYEKEIAEREAKLVLMEIEKKDLAKLDVSLRPTYSGEGYEEELSRVGLQSVGEQLRAEEEGKQDFSSKRKELLDDWVAREVGFLRVGSTSFPIGTITFSDMGNGRWSYKGNGVRTVSTERLIEMGYTPPTNSKMGDRYRIISANKSITAVQFDYYTSKVNIPCLLQTRPIKLGSVDEKHAYRVVLRGVYDNRGEFDISSEAGNGFRVVDSDKLYAYIGDEVRTLYYKELSLGFPKRGVVSDVSPTVKVWRWVDANDKAVSLGAIGIEQVVSIEGEDTLMLSIRPRYAGLYVFGSLDGEHWTPIGATERLLSHHRFHDIGCITHRVGMRYMMVVFVGNLYSDSHIDGLEIGIAR